MPPRPFHAFAGLVLSRHGVFTVPLNEYLYFVSPHHATLFYVSGRSASPTGNLGQQPQHPIERLFWRKSIKYYLMDRGAFLKALSFLKRTSGQGAASLPAVLHSSGTCCFVFTNDQPAEEKYIYFATDGPAEDATQLVCEIFTASIDTDCAQTEYLFIFAALRPDYSANCFSG